MTEITLLGGRWHGKRVTYTGPGPVRVAEPMSGPDFALPKETLYWREKIHLPLHRPGWEVVDTHDITRAPEHRQKWSRRIVWCTKTHLDYLGAKMEALNARMLFAGGFALYALALKQPARGWLDPAVVLMLNDQLDQLDALLDGRDE